MEQNDITDNCSTNNYTNATDLIQRLKLAITADAEELKNILGDPAAEVLHAALKNISINEEHLLKLLQRQDLTSSIIKAVGQHQKSKNHRIMVAIINNPAVSPALAMQLLGNLHLFELLNLCTLPGQSSDIRIAAEHGIAQRLPVEPLGNKIALARRANSGLMLPLLNEGHTQIVAACLDNPRLQEAAVFRFLTGGFCSAHTISQIARHPRWNKRKNLQLAILKNHKTPRVWFIHFLPKLAKMEVRNLLHAKSLRLQQKRWIEDYLGNR